MALCLQKLSGSLDDFVRIPYCAILGRASAEYALLNAFHPHLARQAHRPLQELLEALIILSTSHVGPPSTPATAGVAGDEEGKGEGAGREGQGEEEGRMERGERSGLPSSEQVSVNGGLCVCVCLGMWVCVCMDVYMWVYLCVCGGQW